MNRYSSLFLVLTVFAGSQACYGQAKQEAITGIRKQFQAINADTTFKTITLEGEDFLEYTTDGGCSLTAYLRKDTIVKMVEWIGISYGNRIREYYFGHKALIFVYERFESFVQKEDGLDYTKTTPTFQGRYYFNKGHLIEQRSDGKRTMTEREEDIEKKLKADAADNIELIIHKGRPTR